MGFFFSQKAKGAPSRRESRGLRAESGRPAKVSKQNAATLNRLGCAACTFDKLDGICTPKMGPTHAKYKVSNLVMFLAEAPGRDEDENSGAPLTGPSGSLLRSCITDEDIPYCSFDNVVNCRPPKNRTPEWNEIECCRPRRWAVVEEAKPRLIVGLGVVPLQFMLNSTDMAGMRGRLFAVKVGNHSCWFMPTYHPSFILRIAYDKKKPLNSKMGHCFRMDISRALALAGTMKPPKIPTIGDLKTGVQCFDGSGADHLPRLLKLLSAARAAPLKATDVETYPLRPFAAGAAMMTAAFSFDDTHFAFAVDHPKARWLPEQKKQILAATKEILKDDTIKVAHNAPFELEWFINYFGMDVVNHAAWECTQMQAQFVDERRGSQASGSDDESRRATYQSLGFLYKQHFGIDPKPLFKVNKKDMRTSDLGETLIYNGVDTKCTLALHHRQLALLKKHGTLDAYYEALPRQPTVALVQNVGFPINQAAVKELQGWVGQQVEVLEDKIASLKVVQAYKAKCGEFNPLSSKDQLAIFKDWIKAPEVKAVTKRDREGNETESYSLNKGVLETIGHPLADLIVQIRNRQKLKSTYIDIFEAGKGHSIWPDGRMHTNLNTTFAETGRTSSDSPNSQNFPRRGEDAEGNKDVIVRKQFTAGKGNIILAVDYGQLEGCTGAMCSKDKLMVKMLWEDYDFHSEWTMKLYNKWPLMLGSSEDIKDKPTHKKYRSIIKNKLVFPAIFGAAPESIAGYLNAPEEIIIELMDEFWKTFHGLKHWQDAVMKHYWDAGWVASPTGRRRYYPLTRNQAINHPIQSVAGDIVCDAMCRLSYMAVTTGKWHLHPVLNIHDDLTFLLPDDDKVIDEALETIYRVMLTPPYSFVNVPISVEASLGYNWAPYDKKGNPEGMQEVGKFWSHKDLTKEDRPPWE